jgi:5-methylcytosine-specific restriction endonuclease McrA
MNTYQAKTSPSKSTRIRDKRRRFLTIIARDNGVCHICRQVIENEAYTLDHIIPKGLGGSDGIANQKLAHYECNNARANTPIELLISLQEKLDETDPNWGQADIILLLRKENKKKGEIYKELNRAAPTGKALRVVLEWNQAKQWWNKPNE